MPLVPPYIESLRPYEPGRSAEEVRRAYGLTRVSKLASNENPLGTSPLAIEAIAALHGQPASLSQQRPGSAARAGGEVRDQGGERDRGQRLGRHHLQHHSNIPGRRGRSAHHRRRVHRVSSAGEIARRGVSHGAVSRLALRSDGARGRDQPAHQDRLSRQSEQSHRHDLFKARVRRVLPSRARARPHHSGRSLLRVREGYSALSRFDALPLRQRDHAADIFESVRAGRSPHRLWIRARAPDHQLTQGEAAV